MKTKTLVIVLTVAFFVGFLSIFFLTMLVDLNKSATPWILITLLLFPSNYCIQARLKIAESNENTTLTRSELRRLDPIIDMKKSRLTMLIIFYMISAIVIILGLLLINQASDYFNYLISFCCGLVFSSLSSFIYIKSIMDEIQRFKSILLHRTEEEKKTNELLESLKKD
ncbi:hypothetical protein [Photorhabdus temperata]|uniref:Uncharacterized protein n=1 Tax=Photorhabdus temperata J3 TaxID=1389415 RepID=U7R333_PHOTE|nr:hypothetical protein [Photorhabdus temperata]ERT14080.1 hypothetical protein O185_05435 [Photorhabdus temperata J3]